jgi:hypothetical protein
MNCAALDGCVRTRRRTDLHPDVNVDRRELTDRASCPLLDNRSPVVDWHRPLHGRPLYPCTNSRGTLLRVDRRTRSASPSRQRSAWGPCSHLPADYVCCDDITSSVDHAGTTQYSRGVRYTERRNGRSIARVSADARRRHVGESRHLHCESKRDLYAFAHILGKY